MTALDTFELEDITEDRAPAYERCECCDNWVRAESRDTDVDFRGRTLSLTLGGFYCPCGNIWSNAAQRAENKHTFKSAR